MGIDTKIKFIACSEAELLHTVTLNLLCPLWFRTKISSLLEVFLGLLQPLHPVHDLQIYLRLLKVVSNDSSYPKT